MDLILSLIVLLIVAGLLYWATQKIIAAFGIPAPIATVVQVIFVVVFVLILLGMFTGSVGLPNLRH